MRGKFVLTALTSIRKWLIKQFCDNKKIIKIYINSKFKDFCKLSGFHSQIFVCRDQEIAQTLVFSTIYEYGSAIS